MNKEDKRKLNIENWRQKNAMNKLEKKYKKYRFVSFDVETIGRNNDFYLCGVIDYNGEYTCYFKPQEVIDYFKRIKHNDVIICATNLGFDYSSVFGNSDYFNLCNFTVNNGRFIMIKFDGTYHKQVFYDTLNYGGLSVEKMGDILGKPKLQHPKCLGKKPKNKDELKELIEYNIRDCEVTREYMIYLQETLNMIGGELKSTISSCALDIFRRRFLDFAVTRESISTGLEIRDKIHLAYYGGRTEAFKRGCIGEQDTSKWKDIKKFEYTYLDVNSLYPSVMLNEYPVPDSMMFEPNENRDLLRYEGVSYFEIIVPYTKYPLLPYRKEGKLCFPYGNIKGYYTHLEVRRQIELYSKTKIRIMKDTIYYTRTYKFFKPYVEYMYNSRLKSKQEKSVMEIFYKSLMNNLYGRFALRHVDNTNFFIPHTDEDVLYAIKKASNQAKLNINMDGISYYSEPKEYDSISSIPIWSCYVTAYARILIHQKICETKPVYCDTDSLITTSKIADSKKLGELKLEENVYGAIIIKPKMYFLNEKIKIKGIRIPKDKKHIERLKYNLVNGKTIRYEKFVKMKEGAKRGLKINSIIVIEKHVDLEDTKRDWGGKKFNPYELADSEPLRID